MRCEFCGAQIKEGSNVCEYCGSTVEKTAPKEKVIIKDSGKTHTNVVKIICKGILILACIWAVVVIVSLIVVLNSDVFKDYHTYFDDVDTTMAYGLPRSETGLTGKVISCDNEGTARIEYEGSTYENVKILDERLIAWINDTDRSLDTVGIYFATDENGDISELGLLSAGFFVIEKNSGHYIAVRGEDVLSFTSEIPLETGHFYNGYFTYPDICLYDAKEENLLSMSYMDAQCEDKESVSMQEQYTGEKIDVYKILSRGKWYYCTQDTYDMIQTGDLLKDYDLCEREELAFLIKK